MGCGLVRPRNPNAQENEKLAQSIIRNDGANRIVLNNVLGG